MVASIQALENRGYKVDRAYELLEQGMKAHGEGDKVKLQKISAEIKNEFMNAKKDESSPYWQYK
ncbi:MAG: hypothetical protein K0Q47_1466, partial [Sedimentibacter sp.]|nr:hypothetical protein [Sedimentibacter sp.]